MTIIDQVHAQSANEGHRLLPTVWVLEKGEPITSKTAGPTAVYIIEGVGHHLSLWGICVILMNVDLEILGEVAMEDADDPGKLFHITAGDVILMDEGTVNKISTPSNARGEFI